MNVRFLSEVSLNSCAKVLGIHICSLSSIFLGDMNMMFRGDYARGRLGSCPLSPLPWRGQERQRLPFILNSFHLSYLLRGSFSGFVDNLVQDNFSGASSSRIEFEDQQQPLWRNIHI